MTASTAVEREEFSFVRERPGWSVVLAPELGIEGWRSEID
jgi:hypothetical protein